MAFLPERREKIGDTESVSDVYELTGSEDDRLRQAYNVKKTFDFNPYRDVNHVDVPNWNFQYFMTRSEQNYIAKAYVLTRCIENYIVSYFCVIHEYS